MFCDNIEHMSAVLRLLGPPQLLAENSWTSLAEDKPTLLLLYLASKQSYVARDEILGIFYPDITQSNARTNLRRLIARASKYPLGKSLDKQGENLCLKIQTDVMDFQEANKQSKWLEAIDHYRGDFLAGFSVNATAQLENWFAIEKASLKNSWHRALLKGAVHLEEKNQHDKALELLEHLLKDALNEDVLQTYMRNAYLSGQRSEALKAYEDFRNKIKAELDLEPLSDTKALAELIRHAKHLKLQTVRAQKSFTVLPPTLLSDVKLVGRKLELAMAKESQVPIVLIKGEAGIGKTRILKELAPETLWLQGHEGFEHVMYFPITEHLRAHKHLVHKLDLGVYLIDLARLVPEILPETDYPLGDGKFIEGRLLEAISLYFKSLAKQDQSFTLVLDDFQWVDSATLAVLQYLSNQKGIRILAAFRSHEVTKNLEKHLMVWRTTKICNEINLETLSGEYTHLLLSSLLSENDIPENFVQWFYKYTGGNPFFVLQTLRSLFELGLIDPKQKNWYKSSALRNRLELNLSSEASNVIAQRVSRLSEATQRVLSIASVIREDFTPTLLSKVGGLSEWAVVESLSEAQEVGLIDRYKFSHDLIRQSLYNDLPTVKRNFTHAKVAENLTNVEPLIIAEHWLKADKIFVAWPYLLQAMVHLQTQRMQNECVQLLQGLLDKGIAPPLCYRIQNLIAAGYYETGEFEKAIECSHEIIELTDDSESLIIALLIQGYSYLFTASLDKAISAAKRMVLLEKQVDTPWLHRVIRTFLAAVAFQEEDYDKAIEIMENEVALRKKFPANPELSLAVMCLASLYNYQGSPKSVALKEESLAIGKTLSANKHILYERHLLHCSMVINTDILKTLLPVIGDMLHIGAIENRLN